MTKDIIIGGVSIAQLKATKAAMQQDAVKFINSQIEAGKVAVALMLEAETTEDADMYAETALEAFEAAELVSGVTGVAFYLDFYEEWGSVGDEEPLSAQIEGCENENVDIDYRTKNAVYRLQSLLESMEGQSRDWHSSRC